MTLDTWWPQLQQDSRDWLIAHNGEALSQHVVRDIERVSGPLPAQAWWVGETGPDGVTLTDAAVDWIEEVANDDFPEPLRVRDRFRLANLSSNPIIRTCRGEGGCARPDLPRWGRVSAPRLPR